MSETGQSYFQQAEQFEQLRAVAETWVGTPFALNGSLKGAGVSCQHLPTEIYKECGMNVEWMPPRGTGGAADQEKENRMSAFIAATGRFLLVPMAVGAYERLQPGDLLTFRVVRGEYHLGLFMERQGLIFLHTISPYGVSYSNLYDPTYAQRFLNAWRPQKI